MTNRDVEAARQYHQRTKHSVASVRASGHVLDWESKPRPFKVYPAVEAIPLPRELPPSRMPALTVIATRETPRGEEPQVPDLIALARLLHFSAGIIRKRVYPGGEVHYFRAAACTGALYHIDLYVICGDLPGLPAGVYHFGPHDFALYCLRTGDHRQALIDATGAEPSIELAPAILACASTYWRNSWKYQDRAYRHCFWDCGTMVANLLAVAAADALPTRVVCGFVDDTVSTLLGLDTRREGALALVALGQDRSRPAAPGAALPALTPETLPLSPHEVDYPAIRAMHAASSLRSPEEVSRWRSGAWPLRRDKTGAGQTFALRPIDESQVPSKPIDQVILRRGSARRFARTAIGFDQLSTVLHAATQGVAADFGASPNDLYLIVHEVDGLPAGTYVLHRQMAALELLRAGSFRREAGFLGLGQSLPADAAVNVYALCDLEPVLARLGNRGYRVAQLDAAITGGKLYLAAYALGLGATGLTFFDDDVREFLSLHAAAKDVMFLVAAGHGQRGLSQLR